MTARSRFAAAIALALLAAPVRPALAQSAGDGYLFHAPAATITISGGYARATAGGDLLGDVTRNLTVDRSDFGSFALGADLAVPISSQLEFVISTGVSRASKSSEFRDYVDNNDLPIQQTTTFTRVPLLASVKLDLAPAGRSIGQLAWIPTRVVPYVGAGVGAAYYQFRQEGDFVDFNTSAVFSPTPGLVSSGWAFASQAMAGLQYNLSPRFGLVLDGRYLYAKAKPGGDFSGFDRIDLSGLTGTLGLSFRL